jgi:hypothetical protein
MKKNVLPVLVLLLSATGLFAQNNYAFKNALWYDGRAFVADTWYSVNGKLTHKAPAKIDSTFDLSGRWIVPPMADAFCSSVADNTEASRQLSSCVEEGVFYLQVLTHTQEGRKALEPLVNTPGKVDVAFANGPITCTLGTPFLQNEAKAQGIRNPQVAAQQVEKIKLQRKGLGDSYWFIDDKDALSKNWDKIKAQKPNVLTIYLLDVANKGGKEGAGLSADVAKKVVKKAHKADLQVFAHVQTLADLRLALELGVDGLANLPGYDWDGTSQPDQNQLTDQDLKLLAKKRTVVIPQFSQFQNQLPRKGVREQQYKTLKSLLDAGVNVVIGSNDPQRTIRTELNYWSGLGEFDYAPLLKVLCENTPRAVLPNRKIGRFSEGYEASFLVLKDNPLVNLLKIRLIELKVKNGLIVK